MLTWICFGMMLRSKNVSKKLLKKIKSLNLKLFPYIDTLIKLLTFFYLPVCIANLR